VLALQLKQTLTIWRKSVRRKSRSCAKANKGPDRMIWRRVIKQDLQVTFLTKLKINYIYKNFLFYLYAANL